MPNAAWQSAVVGGAWPRTNVCGAMRPDTGWAPAVAANAKSAIATAAAATSGVPARFMDRLSNQAPGRRPKPITETPRAQAPPGGGTLSER
jgi:hypothetical protein